MARSVVVTGSSSGIGRGIVERFGRAGWSVVGLDLRPPRDPSNDMPETVVGDVRNRTAHEAAARAADRLAPLTAWVNCAGIAEQQSVHVATSDHVERVIWVNLIGAFWGCAVAVESMLNSGGSIVNISSMQALRGVDGYPAYAATKGGVLGLTTQIAAEYASKGIRCNAVLPGVIQTEMNRQVLEQSSDPQRLKRSWEVLTPVGRLGTPADVAELTVFLCEDQASFMTGTAIPVDGGQSVLSADSAITWEGDHR